MRNEAAFEQRRVRLAQAAWDRYTTARDIEHQDEQQAFLDTVQHMLKIMDESYRVQLEAMMHEIGGYDA